VIQLPVGTKVRIAAGVTDLRRGFDGLSAQVQNVLHEQPFSGHVLVFRGRRGDIVKLLWWDGDGLCPFAKRLERGRSSGRRPRVELFISVAHSYRCFWKVSIGAELNARGHQKSRSDDHHDSSVLMRVFHACTYSN